MDVLPVVLDYRGGTRTDRLVEQLRAWNPSHRIYVLDNASPDRRSRYVTHTNSTNTMVGGGIKDCLSLARRIGARFVLFIVNDIDCLTPVLFDEFTATAQSDERIVHVSAAVSADTAQAKIFPWMINRGTGTRLVKHADLLVSLLHLDFIAGFGGFPDSSGGWGYAWELAYHADRSSRRIVVTDACVVRHAGVPHCDRSEEVRNQRRREAHEVYRAKYGRIPWAELRRSLFISYDARDRMSASEPL